MADNDKFHEDMTYDEWAEKQDKDGIEFKAVQEVHNAYPRWTMEDVKEYLPGFISTFTKMMQDIHKNNRSDSIELINQRAVNYISAGIRSDKIHMEVFGVISNSEYNIAKWNTSLTKIMSVIMSPSKYRSEDHRGHSAVVSSRLGNSTVSLRAEMQLSRDISVIADNNRGKYPTNSDLIRELLFKGVEIYSMINRGELGSLADKVLFNREEYRLKCDRLTLQDELDNVDVELSQQYENLEEIIRYEQNKEIVLEEFRNDIVEYLRHKLSISGKIQHKEAIRHSVMRHRDLPRILDTLEREKLISKEYVDNILKRGVWTPYTLLILPEDIHK